MLFILCANILILINYKTDNFLLRHEKLYMLVGGFELTTLKTVKVARDIVGRAPPVTLAVVVVRNPFEGNRGQADLTATYIGQ
jgi:hypothetical protein